MLRRAAAGQRICGRSLAQYAKGPELRNWCQKVGLLNADEDFADRKQRGGKLTVRAARTFIMNYYAGSKIQSADFSKVSTVPVLAKTGGLDEDWECLKASQKDIWNNSGLDEAGRNFSDFIIQ